MSKRAWEDLPVSIEHVRIQFEIWRAQKGKRERILDRLWQMASEAARRHGVHAVNARSSPATPAPFRSRVGS
jgi:hypothetical protein